MQEGECVRKPRKGAEMAYCCRQHTGLIFIHRVIHRPVMDSRSWKESQVSPVSRKWGFWRTVKPKRVVAVLSSLRSSLRNHTVGLRAFTRIWAAPVPWKMRAILKHKYSSLRVASSRPRGSVLFLVMRRLRSGDRLVRRVSVCFDQTMDSDAGCHIQPCGCQSKWNRVPKNSMVYVKLSPGELWSNVSQSVFHRTLVPELLHEQKIVW